MTSYNLDRPDGEVPLLFSPQAEGQPQPWSVTHLGLTYPGEVVVASRWDDAWGSELEGERYFRIVLLTSQRRHSISTLRDARIAVCNPARDVLRQRENLSREMRSIAEARGLYVTRRQPDSWALRSSLEQREVELHREFLQDCSTAYGSGQIRSAASLAVGPGDLFASSDPNRWLQDLAGAILAAVYPTLPVETGSFPRPLSEDDLEGLFNVLLAEASQAAPYRDMGAFALGLGLARKESPYVFDPRDCAVFQLVRRELESRVPRVAVQDVARLLGHSHGLPVPLVSLFLLAFVRYANPETELDLVPEHSLVTRDGTPFPGDRLTWDMVEQVRWHRDLCALSTYLHPPEPPMWNTALPFIQAIDPGAERAAPWEVPSREAALLPRLKELSEDARQALADIRPLLGGQDAFEAERRLQALIALGESDGYRQFFYGVREGFHGTRSLARERLLPVQVRQLKAMFPEISAVRSYLADMTFGPGESALALDHQALLYETGPAHLLESPALWPAVRGRFEQLRHGYRDIYVRHHARYRKEASVLWGSMQRALPLVETLEQLNSIAELGQPVGVDLPYQFDQLNTSLRMCPVPEEEVSLEERPLCPYCGLRLSERVPHQEIEAVLVDVERAVREQNRRLSLQGVQRILEQGGEEMVDKLIRIVSVADLTPLANVLSPQVLVFLRRFVGGQ